MPGKNEMLFKEFVSKSPAIDVGKRQIRFLASTPDVDRDGERILPTAFEKHLAQFLTNSVFLACHQHRLDSGDPSVIGKVTAAWVEEKVGLWAIVQFAESELAEKYWQLYCNGFMKAVSVGFTPIKWHEEFIEGKRITTYDVVEWVELSACAVPSNRGALSRSKQRKQDFIADKIAQRETAAAEITDDEANAFGLIGLSRSDFSEAELAGFSKAELAVLDLQPLSEEDLAELGISDEDDLSLEPNYGAIAKGQSSTEFYDE
jgi:HK97 family phage prohead protease